MGYNIAVIETIHDMEKEVARETGCPVFDVSDWDSGEAYKKYMDGLITFPPAGETFDYLYTDGVEASLHKRVREKLGFPSEENTTIFFSNSTLAIVNLGFFFREKGVKNVAILVPSYFSVAPCLNGFGIETENVELLYDHEADTFYIPMDELEKGDYDAVWITSPVFCTNNYFSGEELDKLNHILGSKTWLVVDESLATADIRISPKLKGNEYLFSIHCPHKVLGTNRMKFACLITHRSFKPFFDNWTDVFAGGLSLSTVQSIEHFASDNYDAAQKKERRYIEGNYEAVQTLLQNYDGICRCTAPAGLYISVILKDIPYACTTTPAFMEALIRDTKASLLPGYLEDFGAQFGFCFRVNLTLDRESILSALDRILNYLGKIYL